MSAGGDTAESVPTPQQPLRADVRGPDPLQRPLTDFAPRMVDGFVIVPVLPALDPTRR